MGTDRMSEFEGPCRCGKGTILIECCDADHPWSVGKPYWYEFSLNCRECSKEYVLQQQGSDFVYVAKSEIREREALDARAAARRRDLYRRPEVVRILASTANLLDLQGSCAATYRLLKSAHLVSTTVETFRKHWTGGKGWVEQYACVYLDEFMKLARIQDGAILEELKAIKQLEEEAKKSPPADGEPIYSL